MDRLVLCGRWDEDPRHLFKALIAFPQVAMEFCISSMDPHLYSHGCSNLCLYDIDLHCMSGSCVQVWVLYHMDLCCILVAMVVYSSHRSSLYCSASMSWLHLSMSQKYWCIVDAYSMTLFDHVDSYLEVTTCSLKSLTYCIPLSIMLWGGILLYPNPITIMW